MCATGNHKAVREGTSLNRTVGWLLRGLQLAVLAGITGCGGERISGPASGPDSIVSVTVSPTNTTIYALGDSVQLEATAHTQSGRLVNDQTFTWESTNPSVASVSLSGVVTAIGAGSTTIMATTEGIIGSAEATVDYWLSVSAGSQFSCALTVRGTAYCWGNNSAGQLGSITETPLVSRPTAVAGGHAFRSISAGFGYACTVTLDNAAYCWGDNQSGQLGNGSRVNTRVPTRVSGDLAFTTVSTMIPVGIVGKHTCGVIESGHAYCWGDNAWGQLGDGSTVHSDVPVAVAGDLTFDLVSVGSRYSCATTTSGAAYCWGSGIGSALAESKEPVAVPGKLQFALISSQFEHTCALRPNGAAYCWGAGVFGKLGDGSARSTATPALVSGSLTFAAINAGTHHTCGATVAGEGYCWGGNGHGCLGRGDKTQSYIPSLVLGQLAFTEISAGLAHSCGVTTSGMIFCWGSGTAGELGDGSFSDSTVPRRINDP